MLASWYGSLGISKFKNIQPNGTSLDDFPGIAKESNLGFEPTKTRFDNINNAGTSERKGSSGSAASAANAANANSY